MATQAPEELMELYTAESPGTVTIGGTRFDSGRFSGPPSKLLPPLRDLCIKPVIRTRAGEVTPRISIEIDAKNGRYTGTIRGYAGAPEQIYLEHRTLGGILKREVVKFDHILSFRLLKVELLKVEVPKA